VGAAFRTLEAFKAQLDVYSFACGRRYERRHDESIDHRKEAFYSCVKCYDAGVIQLQIERRNQSTYSWIVEYICKCRCKGTPSPLVDRLINSGPTALKNQIVGTRDDWKMIANVCFPAGYINGREASNGWSIRCKREDCPGRITVRVSHKRGYGGKNKLSVDSVLDCCQDCKLFGRDTPIVVMQKARPSELGTCLICYEENLLRWVQMPCGKETCYDCLKKLVHSCPEEIKRLHDLVIFNPGRDPTHYYTCPFCRVPYYPATMVDTHSRVLNRGFTVNTVTEEKRVDQVVDTPYSYQSFDLNSQQASVTEQEYPAVMERYQQYLRRGPERTTLESIQEQLPHVDNTNFGRLRVLQQSGLFNGHINDMIDFVNACAFLHDCGLDSGFLWRVAGANGLNTRLELMRDAFHGGWDVDGIFYSSFCDQLVVSCLLRKNMVEVVELDDNDGDDSGANGVL